MEEIWKPISGHELNYEVSTFGRVRRISGGRGAQRMKILKQRPNKAGYLYVGLRVKGQTNGKNKQVHRIVALTFLHRETEDLQVNHIDYNPANNRVDNLEWVTRLENVRHSICHFGKHRGETHKAAKLRECDVRQIRQLHAAGGITIADIARKFGVSAHTCSVLLSGKTWKHVN